MKRIILIVAGLSVATCIVWGFSGTIRATPPPRPMSEAYTMALHALGSDTNGYYCVSAKISNGWCYAGEWVFEFDQDNAEHKLVFVAMKPYESYNPDINLKPWPLTEVRHYFGNALISTNMPPAK